MLRTGSMLDRVTKKLEARRGARIDLRVADARTRGGSDIDLLIRYSAETGLPTKVEIAAFLNKKFDSRLLMGEVADHGQCSRNDGAVHVEASIPRESIDITHIEADPSSWKALDTGKTRYMQVRTAEVWTVDRDSSGNPALFKAEDDDLEELIRAAKMDRTKTAMPGVTFEKLNISAASSVYDIGDTVDYYCKGTRCQGRIINTERDGRGGSRYHIEPAAGGDPDVVPSGFMIECVKKGVGAQASDANRLQEHYRKVYPGTAFADRLTRG